VGAVIDVLDAGRMAKVCGAGAGLEALLLAQRLFVFEDDAEPLGMRQRARLGVRLQRLVTLRHAVEAEAVQEIEGGMGQHRSVSCQWK
jgi:hypothetical protein